MRVQIISELVTSDHAGAKMLVKACAHGVFYLSPTQVAECEEQGCSSIEGVELQNEHAQRKQQEQIAELKVQNEQLMGVMRNYAIAGEWTIIQNDAGQIVVEFEPWAVWVGLSWLARKGILMISSVIDILSRLQLGTKIVRIISTHDLTEDHGIST